MKTRLDPLSPLLLYGNVVLLGYRLVRDDLPEDRGLAVGENRFQAIKPRHVRPLAYYNPASRGDHSTQCSKPLDRLRRKKQAKHIYQVRWARVFDEFRGRGLGTTLYESTLLALREKHGEPVALIADACVDGSTSADARRVYASLHKRGYAGSGLVVSSEKNPPKRSQLPRVVRLETDPQAPRLRSRDGYGPKVPTGRVAVLDNGERRKVWMALWSNAGTPWILWQGQKYAIDAHDGIGPLRPFGPRGAR